MKNIQVTIRRTIATQPQNLSLGSNTPFPFGTLNVDIDRLLSNPDLNYSQSSREGHMNPVAMKLIESWPRRARVRTEYELPDSDWDKDRIDYPMELLPFHKHPSFLRLSDEEKSKILTISWLAFNHSVVTLEEEIVNPALNMLARTTANHFAQEPLRIAIQQMLIDEHFHTLMHIRSASVTARLRNLDQQSWSFPKSVAFRSLLQMQERHNSKWAQDITKLTWAVIAEVRIPVTLGLLASDTSIQPQHRRVAHLHQMDELAHTSIVSEVCRTLYFRMSSKEKSLFAMVLQEAIHSIFSADNSLWIFILKSAGVSDADEILLDCTSSSSSPTQRRDNPKLRELIAQLEIQCEI